MSAPAEDGEENVSLVEAYPRDVILRYIIKPTIVNHPILTMMLFLLFTTIHPLICSSSDSQPSICAPVPRRISLVVGACPLLLMLYVWYKCYLLSRASSGGRQE